MRKNVLTRGLLLTVIAVMLFAMSACGGNEDSLGKEAEGLDFPPYPGELGKRIWESVSKQAWQDWLRHQTMLVNENRLNMADQRAREYLKRQMEAHFFGAGADQAAGYVPPTQ